MSPFFYIGISSFHMVSYYQEPVTVSHLIPSFICLQKGCGVSMEKKEKAHHSLWNMVHISINPSSHLRRYLQSQEGVHLSSPFSGYRRCWIRAPFSFSKGGGRPFRAYWRPGRSQKGKKLKQETEKKRKSDAGQKSQTWVSRWGCANPYLKNGA